MSSQMINLLINFALTIVLAIIIIPILKKIKVGQIERDDGPKSHLKKQGTPTMGGIIFIFSIVICVIINYFYYKNNGYQNIASKLLPMLILTLGFGLIGFIDDYRKLVMKNTDGLKPKYKMFGLLIISVLYILYLIFVAKHETCIVIPIAKIICTMPIALYIIFSIFVILGTTNAINLTDGVDGLGASVSAIIVACLTVIGIIKGVPEVAVFGICVIGSVLGFLIFNLYPAKVFMGDTGSLFLGGVISCMAVYLNMPLILIIVAIIPILETLSVIIQVAYYKKTGNRIFKMAPLHHHFELSGWNENKVVRVFSMITLIASILGILMV